MVQVQPVDEQTNDVIRAEPRSRGISHEVGDVFPLVLSLSAIPCSKRRADQAQVFLALNSFINGVAEVTNAIALAGFERINESALSMMACSCAVGVRCLSALGAGDAVDL